MVDYVGRAAVPDTAARLRSTLDAPNERPFCETVMLSQTIRSATYLLAPNYSKLVIDMRGRNQAFKKVTGV